MYTEVAVLSGQYAALVCYDIEISGAVYCNKKIHTTRFSKISLKIMQFDCLNLTFLDCVKIHQMIL